VLISAFHFEAQAGSEVFFVTDHDVNVLGDFAVDLLSAFLAALALPERCAVVQVIGNYSAVLLSDFNGFQNGFSSVRSQRSKDAAGLEPTHAFFAKQLFPVHFTRTDLRSSGVTAVGATQSRTRTEALFREVQANAGVAAQTVKITPDDVGHVHAALHDEVFNQPAQIVLRQSGHNRSALAPALAHGASHVVLAAAFPNLELTGVAHAAEARVETQHHFAKGYAVPLGFCGGFDLQFSHFLSFLERLNCNFQKNHKPHPVRLAVIG